ncbi:INO80 complex subunit E isoform X2 [Carettochelys insculpta]|uniref:INO80 complex subunit E isoform X2 n=1 Tax=Carettochelys insculpta TaxID=44489 RepID=UPI003EB76EF1
MNGAEAESGGYKRRYRALKRRLKLLIYEQECFQEELRKAQRKLLKFPAGPAAAVRDRGRGVLRLRGYSIFREQRWGGAQERGVATTEEEAEPSAWRSLIPLILGPFSARGFGLPPAGLRGTLPLPQLAGFPPLQPIPLRVPGTRALRPPPRPHPPRATGQGYPQAKDVPAAGRPSRLLGGGGSPLLFGPRGAPGAPPL